ncbi:MAG: molecular chaperone HtpG [Oscillospiraceae bacterium]|nr:molecular chaperone HtpG [Oscillospiraceae bacterium]
MEKKEFKAESKKLLEMMINSIYTHKEIFLRELISNASDALDKAYINALGSDKPLTRDELEVKITPDETARTLVIEDNGIGMTQEELENNLGIIAKSGSLDFKSANSENDIIGQFGVGFYSAFMVAKKVEVVSKPEGADKAYKWESHGADGYTVTETDKDTRGTVVTLYLKDNETAENTTDEDNHTEDYAEYLKDWKLRQLIKKYSDYVRYPIKAYVTKHIHEDDPDKPGEHIHKDVKDWDKINSQIPLWKKSKSEITEDEYAEFYKEKFTDWQPPLATFHTHTEGSAVSYDALLYIPEKPPYNFYSKEFEKGLNLYSAGVLITDKCKELLPDFFSFIRGLADSPDVSLNISRELLQQDRQLKTIAKGIERFIKNELKKLLVNDREKYEKFWDSFGTQIKFGVYDGFGANKELLKDLLLFKTSADTKEDGTPKLSSIEEYISRMKKGEGEEKTGEQTEIYFASGASVAKIKSLPQVENAVAKGYEVIYLTDNVDEFALQMLVDYEGKTFKSVQSADFDSSTEEEKAELAEKNTAAKDIFEVIKEHLGDKITEVRFSAKLGSRPVALSASGALSLGMEKVLSEMPTAAQDEHKPKADKILEINANHAIADKLRYLADNDKTLLNAYADILYGQALLIEGIIPDDPADFTDKVVNALL